MPSNLEDCEALSSPHSPSPHTKIFNVCMLVCVCVCVCVSHTSLAPSFIARSSKRRQNLAWNLATWYVRSVLDVEGSVETARQGREVSYSEDRKIDRVVGEMQRYKVYIGALQETKWFGSKSYKVGDSIVLTSGRPTPQPGQSGQRGEGVALVLSGPALDAWKAGGQQWRSWNSRLISAAFGKPGSGFDRLQVLSCYAPTFAASRVEKDQFFDSLQQALDDVPPSECYVVLGDFNARVGSRVNVGEDWEGVRGPHGFGEVNEAGKELLTFFLLMNLLCVTLGLRRSEYTNKPGSIQSQRGGIVLTMPSLDRWITTDAWMLQ